MKGKQLKVGSLFSGIGGIDYAFVSAGFRVAWANELDPYACKTYRLNFPETDLINADIRNLNPNLLKKIDVLTAGFPCQPFSVCGNQHGFKDKIGNLFFEIMRIADVLQPPVIFLENVSNLTEHDHGKTFNIVYNELACRNYFLRYLIADASDYGIPQHRTRIYIAAFKSKSMCDNFSFPQQSKSKKHIFDVLNRDEKCDNFYYLSQDSRQYSRLLSSIKDENQIYRFSDYGIQASKDGISFTLKANMGVWYNRVPFIKDTYGIRTITPKECLALMGFPEKYNFPDNVPLKEQYKQCGNTVAFPLIKKIAENIGKQLL